MFKEKQAPLKTAFAFSITIKHSETLLYLSTFSNEKRKNVTLVYQLIKKRVICLRLKPKSYSSVFGTPGRRYFLHGTTGI